MLKRQKNTAIPDHEGMGSLSDGELLQLHAGSDHNEYLGHLYNRYTPLIYGVCLKYLRNADDASDAVMAIFEQLVERIDRYQIGEFRTWIYSVTKNHCIQMLRKGSPEVATDNFDRHVVETAGVTHLLTEGDEELRHRALESCLGRLPEPQKKCIEMFFFGKKSYADIATETRWPQKSVKSHIQNGKRNLKICIEKQEHGNN